MASKIYEFRVYRQGRNRQQGDPFLASVNFEEADRTGDLLNRHLLGAVLRLGADRRDQHLYHLEGHEINHEGKGRGPAAWRWALPAAEGV